MGGEGTSPWGGSRSWRAAERMGQGKKKMWPGLGKAGGPGWGWTQPTWGLGPCEGSLVCACPADNVCLADPADTLLQGTSALPALQLRWHLLRMLSYPPGLD